MFDKGSEKDLKTSTDDSCSAEHSDCGVNQVFVKCSERSSVFESKMLEFARSLKRVEEMLQQMISSGKKHDYQDEDAKIEIEGANDVALEKEKNSKNDADQVFAICPWTSSPQRDDMESKDELLITENHTGESVCFSYERGFESCEWERVYELISRDYETNLIHNDGNGENDSVGIAPLEVEGVGDSRTHTDILIDESLQRNEVTFNEQETFPKLLTGSIPRGIILHPDETVIYFEIDKELSFSHVVYTCKSIESPNKTVSAQSACLDFLKSSKLVLPAGLSAREFVSLGWFGRISLMYLVKNLTANDGGNCGAKCCFKFNLLTKKQFQHGIEITEKNCGIHPFIVYCTFMVYLLSAVFLDEALKLIEGTVQAGRVVSILSAYDSGEIQGVEILATFHESSVVSSMRPSCGTNQLQVTLIELFFVKVTEAKFTRSLWNSYVKSLEVHQSAKSVCDRDQCTIISLYHVLKDLSSTRCDVMFLLTVRLTSAVVFATFQALALFLLWHPSYLPPIIIPSSILNYVVALSWEQVTNSFKSNKVLSSSMVGIVQMLLIVGTIEYSIQDFAASLSDNRDKLSQFELVILKSTILESTDEQVRNSRRYCILLVFDPGGVILWGQLGRSRIVSLRMFPYSIADDKDNGDWIGKIECDTGGDALCSSKRLSYSEVCTRNNFYKDEVGGMLLHGQMMLNFSCADNTLKCNNCGIRNIEDILSLEVLYDLQKGCAKKDYKRYSNSIFWEHKMKAVASLQQHGGDFRIFISLRLMILKRKLILELCFLIGKEEYCYIYVLRSFSWIGLPK